MAVLGRVLRYAGFLGKEVVIGEASHADVDEKLETGVVVGVKVVAVSGGELSHRHERRKREEVIVKSALAASHFKWQRAVGLDLVDAEFVRADAPVVKAPVVGGDAGGERSESGPVDSDC